MLPCLPIAATVTALGRQTIAMTKEVIERCFEGSTVLYGDTGKFLLMLVVPHSLSS